MSKSYNVAIIGASGVVGQKMVEVLEERNFPINELSLFASHRSAGDTVKYKGNDIEIQELTEDSLKAPIQIALFSAGGSISEKFAPIAAENGLTVIDNSSFFRMDEDKPLVVPEINGDILDGSQHIIANPNCSTTQSVVPLKVIQDKYGIKRIVFNTYQAVSGAGKEAIEDLVNRTTKALNYPIYETVIPQIDVFEENGYTKEEMKMINETHKILRDNNIPITATAVRVPIKTSHGISINVETEKPFELEEVRDAFNAFPGLVVIDDPANQRYPLQNEAEDSDNVYVGRIRRDESVENGLNLWVVADNLRKGAATNSVQIAEYLIEKDLI